MMVVGREALNLVAARARGATWLIAGMALRYTDAAGHRATVAARPGAGLLWRCPAGCKPEVLAAQFAPAAASSSEDSCAAIGGPLLAMADVVCRLDDDHPLCDTLANAIDRLSEYAGARALPARERQRMVTVLLDQALSNDAVRLSGVTDDLERARRVEVAAPRHGVPAEVLAARIAELLNGARPCEQARSALPAPTGWAAAQTIDAFLREPEPDAQYLVDGVIAREAVTVIASPRGLGKTNLAYSWAIDCAQRGLRVLIIDRDNPRREIRRRLRACGAERLGDRLRILTRDGAPPLTDRKAWAAFPVAEYDLIVLDSISVATEGVEERDGGKAGAGLAPLLDAVRKGPAFLVLANTTKDGLKVRGSGTISDRCDIVYEVRDATDLQPTAKHGAWWDALPPGGEERWSDRAKRRRHRDRYRLALVCSKFRLGEEPDAHCYELRHDTEPWSATDVTADLRDALDGAKRAAADAEQQRVDAAVAALAAALPIDRRTAAVDLLREHGLSRDTARRVIAERMGRDWSEQGSGIKGAPVLLISAAGIAQHQSPSAAIGSKGSIPVGTGAQGQPESAFKNASPAGTLATHNSGGQSQDIGGINPEAMSDWLLEMSGGTGFI